MELISLLLYFSIPEVPSLPDVPYITIEVSSELDEKLAEFIGQEGRILERAPVQIIDIIERPGGLTVKWSEVCPLPGVEFRINIFYIEIFLKQFHFHT